MDNRCNVSVTLTLSLSNGYVLYGYSTTAATLSEQRSNRKGWQWRDLIPVIKVDISSVSTCVPAASYRQTCQLRPPSW